MAAKAAGEQRNGHRWQGLAQRQRSFRQHHRIGSLLLGSGHGLHEQLTLTLLLLSAEFLPRGQVGLRHHQAQLGFRHPRAGHGSQGGSSQPVGRNQHQQQCAPAQPPQQPTDQQLQRRKQRCTTEPGQTCQPAITWQRRHTQTNPKQWAFSEQQLRKRPEPSRTQRRAQPRRPSALHQGTPQPHQQRRSNAANQPQPNHQRSTEQPRHPQPIEGMEGQQPAMAHQHSSSAPHRSAPPRQTPQGHQGDPQQPWPTQRRQRESSQSARQEGKPPGGFGSC